MTDDRRRFHLLPFAEIGLPREQRYAIKGLIPCPGLTVVWGPPKCGKSFLMGSASTHLALGWEFFGHRVSQGTVVYLALEGADGFKKRVEAFRQRFLTESTETVPFYLIAGRLELVRDQPALVHDIRAQIGKTKPVLVVIDTLNRSLSGSESSDEDMAAYIAAADAIKEAFDCAVVVVHHCGVDGTRPRGHTSLGGAVDAQIAVRKDEGGIITAKVEWMKDGPEGEEISCRLETVELGTDQDGDAITSCVIVTTEPAPAHMDRGPRLSANQQTMFSVLREASPPGLIWAEWSEQTKAIGVGQKRDATLFDIRTALKNKDLVYQHGDLWVARR